MLATKYVGNAFVVIAAGPPAKQLGLCCQECRELESAVYKFKELVDAANDAEEFVCYFCGEGCVVNQ